MKQILAGIAVVVLIWTNARAVAFHEYPDNYIDRSIAVVIRDRDVIIEYSAGMNDSTIRKLVDQWKADDGKLDGMSVGQIDATFRAVSSAKLRKGLKIECNGVVVELKPSKNQAKLRRHHNVTAEYEFTLPTTEQPVQLSICDQNFAQFDGAIRMSLKATGAAILTSSSVAPILVRAEPVDITGLNVQEKSQASTIEGQVILAPGPGSQNSLQLQVLAD